MWSFDLLCSVYLAKLINFNSIIFASKIYYQNSVTVNSKLACKSIASFQLVISVYVPVLCVVQKT